MSDIEFNIYRPDDLKLIPTGRATLTISKVGMFGLSSNTVLATGVKEGDRVILVQNKNAPREWFLTMDDDGFIIRVKSNKETRVGFSSINLMRLFYKSLELDVATMWFTVSKEPIEIGGKKYFAIITSSGKRFN